MRRINLLDSGLDDVAPALGAEQIRARLYELGDGEPSQPYHFHHGVEEWVLGVAGSPTVRSPEGERKLRPGDVVCFPVGPSGAHRVTGPGTVLVLGESRDLDTVEYPDSGELAVFPPGKVFRTADGADASADDEHDRRPPRLPRAVTEPVNVYEIRVEANPASPAGYRSSKAELGPSLGAARLGATVYEIDSGQSGSPYHFEGVEEEWLIVLTGTPTLRDPEGEHELAPGDVVCFETGPAGAHKVTNRSAVVARFLMLSTIPDKELSICVYPDSDKVGVWPWPAKRLRMSAAVDYWEGEA
ncbi:MAG TPA: cupin domain-containing protein [Solirubrobacteraceae bacterium]|nr:cupin domain-containing protein [Solirubrobacteraceae bacterium]